MIYIGPEIPLFTENYDFSINTPDRLITICEETNLDMDSCISLKLKAVNIILDKDISKMTTFRVSLGVSAKTFLQYVCSKLKIPFSQAKFSSWKNADGTDCQPLTFSDFDTLYRLGIQKNSIISVCKDSTEVNQASASINMQIRKNENAEGSSINTSEMILSIYCYRKQFSRRW